MTMLPIVRQNNTVDLIISVFKISTAHLPEEVMDDLIRGNFYWHYWELERSGVYCLVPDSLEDWRMMATRLPRELFDVLRHAYDKGCSAVWFHPDGDEADNLPTWDW